MGGVVERAGRNVHIEHCVLERADLGMHSGDVGVILQLKRQIPPLHPPRRSPHVSIAVPLLYHSP